MTIKREIKVTTTVYRILVYKGDSEWVKHSLDNRAVKDKYLMGNGNYISEAFLDYVPETVIEEKLTFINPNKNLGDDER